jgi:hypothetical protein
MTATIVIIFLVVYLGMILGGLPFLQLHGTGVALLGAIALISVDAVSLEEAAGSIHLPTVILLITNFGDPFLTLPLASAILAWLVATRRVRLAVYWFAFFSCAAALVGATKFAYAGWGFANRQVGFHCH